MAKYEKRVTGDFNSILQHVHGYVMDSALSMELIDAADYETGGARVAVKVYDKYYMRSSSRASLTVMMVEDGSDVMVCAIGAGGSTGALLNFSWGAEEDFVGVVAQALSGY